MFTPHPSAALEYFFFKVNAGPIALIVDWIERRKLNEHILRASVHSPYKREVIFEKLDSFMPADNFMTTQRTVGHAGEVSGGREEDGHHVGHAQAGKGKARDRNRVIRGHCRHRHARRRHEPRQPQGANRAEPVAHPVTDKTHDH